MTATELDELQTLLEHVLPDPAGYAQRLALQVMTQWGQAAAQGTGSSYPSPASSASSAQGDIVITLDQREPDETSVDTNLLLAAALGACECWGLRAECEICRGNGSAGWLKPDPELFEEFVQPAVDRLSRRVADDREPDSAVTARKDGHQDPTAKEQEVMQGVSNE
jgi:hypothetical protein